MVKVVSENGPLGWFIVYQLGYTSTNVRYYYIPKWECGEAIACGAMGYREICSFWTQFSIFTQQQANVVVISLVIANCSSLLNLFYINVLHAYCGSRCFHHPPFWLFCCWCRFVRMTTFCSANVNQTWMHSTAHTLGLIISFRLFWCLSLTTKCARGATGIGAKAKNHLP